MRRVTASLSVAGLVVFLIGVAHADEQVLHYEPSVVGLTGTIRMERHFGPPNFGQTPQTDRVETVPILILDRPVTVQGSPGSPDGDSYSHVTRVQLVVAIPGGNDLSGFAGKHVLATGRLFEKVSGENFTDVLLDTQQIGLAPSGSR